MPPVSTEISWDNEEELHKSRSDQAKPRSSQIRCLPKVQPIDDLHQDLLEFLQTCESCLGPKGRLKMIVSTSGALRTTATSSRLWDLLQFDHLLVEFIIGAGKVLADHGLLCAALTARLLASGPDQELDGAWLSDRILAASVPLDLASLAPMISLVRTVLASQASASGLLREELEQLSRAVVEAWLCCLPEGGGEVGEVVVRVAEGGGAGEVRVTPGLLYRHEPTYGDCVRDMEGGVRVALYNVMLEHQQSGEEWEGLTLEYRRGGEKGPLDLVAQLEGLGVGLLACQKVVGQGVRERLEQELGVQVVERLGTANFSRLLKMVGGRVVSSPAHRLQAQDLGWVDRLKKVEMEGRGYLHLQKEGAGLVSLAMGSLGEEQGEELELVLNKAVAALTELVTQIEPRVVPGAGCLESALAIQAEGSLGQALARLAVLPSGLAMEEAGVDTRHGHLWEEEGHTCVCGLVARQPGLEVVPLLQVLHQSGREVLAVDSVPADRSLVIDSLEAKRRALTVALETAKNLANIGCILTC